jgi:hypothetical protein
MSHIVHIIDEMDRNTFECFSQMLKVGGDVFDRGLESPLFHRESLTRLDAWISIKHMPDRIHGHCLVASFGDVIDDIAHRPCAGAGMFLSDANDSDMDDTSLPFSIQIFDLQAAANALTSRIVKHIRRRSPELRATRKLGTKLILVPKGGTAHPQYLDRRIYGALKSKARAKFDRMIDIEHNPSLTKEATAKLAQQW